MGPTTYFALSVFKAVQCNVGSADRNGVSRLSGAKRCMSLVWQDGQLDLRGNSVIIFLVTKRHQIASDWDNVNV